jgi:hypothetical protein
MFVFLAAALADEQCAHSCGGEAADYKLSSGASSSSSMFALHMLHVFASGLLSLLSS